MWHIYTEDVNRRKVERLAKKEFGSVTLIPAIGMWNGNKEQSLIVELATGGMTPLNATVVFEFARKLKKLNNQQAVSVSWVPDYKWLI